MRIISGTYGGRPLQSLVGNHTRPTSDKLKESMFNIIGPYFKGGKVLDLYAGSGALGIEAVSRGMDGAVLVDSNPAAINVINENIRMTKEATKFEVIPATAEIALNTLTQKNEKFTLVFLDPPYAEQKIEEDIEQLLTKELLADVALIVCEAAGKVELPANIYDIQLWDERNYGNKKLVIYQKIS